MVDGPGGRRGRLAAVTNLKSRRKASLTRVACVEVLTRQPRVRRENLDDERDIADPARVQAKEKSATHSWSVAVGLCQARLTGSGCRGANRSDRVVTVLCLPRTAPLIAAMPLSRPS